MNQLEAFRSVKTFIFDVDGVLTNSEIVVTESGQLLRKMNTRDGMAMKRAVQKGYKLCIITGGRSQGVVKRLQGLGITDIYSGCDNKVEAFEELISIYEIDPATVLYMGDDINDYQAMRLVGFPTCPKNAAPEIIGIAQYISPYDGGRGCARDVIEKVLKLNGDWMDDPKDVEFEIETP